MLIDFEGVMADEMTVRAGDVVKNVTKGQQDGWLEGELGGKRGIFPANFVKVSPSMFLLDCMHYVHIGLPSRSTKGNMTEGSAQYLYVCAILPLCLFGVSRFFTQEVPVYLIGDSNRQPRSMRKCESLCL